MQTDASINPATRAARCSICTARSSASTRHSRRRRAGDRLAIPINMVKQLIPMLMRDGKITRSALGVHIRDVRDLTNEDRLALKLSNEKGTPLVVDGAVIEQVDPGGLPIGRGSAPATSSRSSREAHRSRHRAEVAGEHVRRRTHGDGARGSRRKAVRHEGDARAAPDSAPESPRTFRPVLALRRDRLPLVEAETFDVSSTPYYVRWRCRSFGRRRAGRRGGRPCVSVPESEAPLKASSLPPAMPVNSGRAIASNQKQQRAKEAEEDRALITRAQAGDTVAFRQLVERHQRRPLPSHFRSCATKTTPTSSSKTLSFESSRVFRPSKGARAFYLALPHHHEPKHRPHS